MSKGYTKGSGKAPGKKGKAGKVVAVVLAGVILVCAGGVSGWFLNERFGKKAEIDHDNQLAFTPGEEDGIMRLSAETVVAEGGAKVHRLTATLQPEGAEDSVDWSISWGETAVYWDGQEIGQDKVDKGEVTDYVTLTPTSAGACTADVVGIKDFGTQIIITAAAHSDPYIKATCTVDYVERLARGELILTHTEPPYSASMELTFRMTDGSNEAEALRNALTRAENPQEFPNFGWDPTKTYIQGACAADENLIEGTTVISKAELQVTDEGSYTYALHGDDFIFTESATLRYAQAFVYGMSYIIYGGAQDQIVFYTTDNADYKYRPTWEEFRSLDAQILYESGDKYVIKKGDRPLRIKDVMVNRFTDQPDPYAEDGVSLGAFDMENNENGIIYNYEKKMKNGDFDWDTLKSQLQTPDTPITGETMSKKSLVFKLEIPKTGQVGFYALEFSFSASAVSLDTGNLYL